MTPGGVTEADVTKPLVIQTSYYQSSSGPNSSSTDTASEACSLFNSPHGATSLSPSGSPNDNYQGQNKAQIYKDGNNIAPMGESNSSLKRRLAGDSSSRSLESTMKQPVTMNNEDVLIAEVRMKDIKRRVAHQKFTPKVKLLLTVFCKNSSLLHFNYCHDLLLSFTVCYYK